MRMCPRSETEKEENPLEIDLRSADWEELASFLAKHPVRDFRSFYYNKCFSKLTK